MTWHWKIDSRPFPQAQLLSVLFRERDVAMCSHTHHRLAGRSMHLPLAKLSSQQVYIKHNNFKCIIPGVLLNLE